MASSEINPRLEQAKLKLTIAQAIGTLVEDERWKNLVEAVQHHQRVGFMSLATKNLTLDELRYWQGHLAALAIFTQTKGANDRSLEGLISEIGEMESDQEVMENIGLYDLPQQFKDELLASYNSSMRGQS